MHTESNAVSQNVQVRQHYQTIHWEHSWQNPNEMKGACTRESLSSQTILSHSVHSALGGLDSTCVSNHSRDMAWYLGLSTQSQADPSPIALVREIKEAGRAWQSQEGHPIVKATVNWQQIIREKQRATGS